MRVKLADDGVWLSSQPSTNYSKNNFRTDTKLAYMLACFTNGLHGVRKGWGRVVVLADEILFYRQLQEEKQNNVAKLVKGYPPTTICIVFIQQVVLHGQSGSQKKKENP